MLYVFAGFPGKNLSADSQHLHAGGLQYAVETVEELAVLEHDSAVNYYKEGVFTAEKEEFLHPIEYRMSDMCLRDGITWDWFPESFTFGNGVTCGKWLASPEYKTVVYGSDLSLDDFLALHGPTRLADLKLSRNHWITEGWTKYKARWLPGMCPQVNHIVHLTWLVVDHHLPEFAYERIRDLVERDAEPKSPELFTSGQFSRQLERYDGKTHFHRG